MLNEDLNFYKNESPPFIEDYIAKSCNLMLFISN